jgi:putative colanic acid biosysnthesis UDP-glucose lipid carrier transferase
LKLVQSLTRKVNAVTVDTRFPSLGYVVSTRAQFSISSQVLPGVIVGLDAFAILSAAFITYSILLAGSLDDPGHYFAAVSFVCLVTIMLLNFAGLYQLEAIMRPVRSSGQIIIAFMTTVLFLLAAAFSLKVSADFSRLWMGSFAAGACAATIALRLVASLALGRLADMQVFTRHVVVIGTGEQARKLLVNIDALQPRFISIVGVFGETSESAPNTMGRHPVLGNIDTLAQFARRHRVDDVIIAMPWSADEQIGLLVSKLRQLPVNVYLGSDLVGFILPFRSPPDHFGDTPVVEVMDQPLAGWGVVHKGALDYGLALALTVVLLPLMFLVALAIKLDSKGPILFRQKRYGFVNRLFHIYKFRTMRHVEAPEGPTQQATRNDPRVTRVGRFLRRTSLDELPQLFNVLNGTMSLVGPRPHATDHDEIYSRVIMDYFVRHRVKPGITGWAQVNGFRGETKTLDDIKARVEHDIYYVENWSLLFDLKVLLKTALICLHGRNAY